MHSRHFLIATPQGSPSSTRARSGTPGLSEQGFLPDVHCGIVILTFLPSAPTFASIIDPGAGAQELSYRLSRKIPPGDVERFYIVVGTKMTAKLSVKFKFYVDQGTILLSDPVDLDLSCPTDCRLPIAIADGTEFVQSTDGGWYLPIPEDSNPWFRRVQIDTDPTAKPKDKPTATNP